MSSKERRDRERGELRTLIIDHARQLFATEGYAAVSMRRIAEAIDYSPAAIYVHFKDKESLIREMCSEDFGRLAMEFARFAKIDDPVDRIRKAGHFYIHFAVEHPNHYKLMFMTEMTVDKDEQEWADTRGNPESDAYAFLLHSVREAMAASRIRPDLTDPQLVAQTFWAVVHGVASLQITQANDPWVDWVDINARAVCAIEASITGLTVERSKRRKVVKKRKRIGGR